VENFKEVQINLMTQPIYSTSVEAIIDVQVGNLNSELYNVRKYLMHSLAAAEISGLGMNSPDICFFGIHVEGNQEHMRLELG